MSVEELRLPTRANVEVAQDVVNRAAALEEGRTLALDATEVNEIDGPAAIAFAALARRSAENGAKLVVKSPTSAFVDAFSDLGLFEDLMKMEFIK